MKLKFSILIACIFILSASSLKADSPITSTFFAGNYGEYPIIQQTIANPVYSEAIAAFLLDKHNAIDAKAALINALGWEYETTNRADKFKESLAKKYGTSPASLQMSSLNAEELMCLGYIMAFDNYFAVDDAINILQMAKNKNPESFTINMILALVKGQKAMDLNYCEVWSVTADVLNDKSLFRDMKTASIQVIVDYMILYKVDCYYEY